MAVCSVPSKWYGTVRYGTDSVDNMVPYDMYCVLSLQAPDRDWGHGVAYGARPSLALALGSASARTRSNDPRQKPTFTDSSLDMGRPGDGGQDRVHIYQGFRRATLKM